MATIDIGEFASFPDELIEIVKKNICIFEKYIPSDTTLEDSIINCLLEPSHLDYDRELKVLFDQIVEELRKHMIIGYHVTRVLSIDEILTNGLLMLEYESYSKRLRDILESNGIDENTIEQSLEKINRMYEGELGERKKRVCFFAPISQLYDGNFDCLGVNCGGEIADRALEEIDSVWQVLTSVGTPVCVKFRFRLQDIYEFQFDSNVMSFIKKIVCRVLLNYDYTSYIGQHIKKSIPASDIISVYQITIREF